MARLSVKDGTLQEGVDMNDMDEQFRKDVAFAAVCGKRYKDSNDWLKDGATKITLVMLALMLEPLRYLTGFWMKAASDLEGPCRPPRLMDVVYPPFDPTLHALQYLGSMLSGNVSRLILVWRTAGCETFQMWCRQCKGQVRRLRRCCLLTACWLYRRHLLKYDRYPWLLATLADTRRPEAEREAVASRFLNTQSCCLREGMARKLKAHLEQGSATARDMLQGTWMHIWFYFAVLVTMQVADIEWRHGRNRSRSNKHGQTSVSQFTAKYIGCEAKNLHAAQVARIRLTHDRSKKALADDPLEPPGSPGGRDVGEGGENNTLLRTPSAFMLWRKEAIRRDRQLGSQVNPASELDWAARRNEWASLTAEEKRTYEEESEKLSPIAKRNRDLRREQARAIQRARVAEIGNFIHGVGAGAGQAARGDPGARLALDDGVVGGGRVAVASADRRCSCMLAPSTGGAEGGVHGASPWAHQPRYHSLNISSGFSVEGECLRAGSVLQAAVTAESRLQEETASAPLSGDNLEFLRSQRREHGSARQAAQTSTKKANTFVNPEAPPFPNEVTYPECCPYGLCTKQLSPQETRFFNDFRACLDAIARSFGKPAPACLAQADVVLGMFVHQDRAKEADDVLYVSFPAASFQAGRVAPSQTFVVWSTGSASTGQDDCVGIHLKIAYNQFQRPGKKVRAPLDQQVQGSPKMLTEHALYARLRCLLPDGDDLLDGPVFDALMIRKAKYDDITIEEIVIQGWDEEFGTKAVLANHVVPKGKRRKTDGVDFMDLLAPPRARRSDQPGCGSAASSSTHAPVAAAPVDPPGSVDAHENLEHVIGLANGAADEAAAEVADVHADDHELQGIMHPDIADIFGVLEAAEGCADDEEDAHTESDALPSADEQEVGTDEPAPSGPPGPGPSEPSVAPPPAPAAPAPPNERQELLSRVGLAEPSRNRFSFSDDGSVSGVVYTIGGKGVKATCQHHHKKACNMYLTIREGEPVEEIELRCIEWLGNARGLPLERHMDRAREVKISRGMRPRT
ncbi:unnamed protein product [Prorocentrum cordatum]|uniref:HMG box domain-containing protein n=1 Tax=Prorocentrum cordatum TaxID=2364126 RepID=A0ABN9XAH3_9DINO|nr:unnamed protein product [Polarella glacialis]